MNKIVFDGGPSYGPYVRSDPLRRLLEDLRRIAMGWTRRRDREPRRRHYPVQRGRIFEEAAMAREMYRL